MRNVLAARFVVVAADGNGKAAAMGAAAKSDGSAGGKAGGAKKKAEPVIVWSDPAPGPDGAIPTIMRGSVGTLVRGGTVVVKPIRRNRVVDIQTAVAALTIDNEQRKIENVRLVAQVSLVGCSFKDADTGDTVQYTAVQHPTLGDICNGDVLDGLTNQELSEVVVHAMRLQNGVTLSGEQRGN